MITTANNLLAGLTPGRIPERGRALPFVMILLLLATGMAAAQTDDLRYLVQTDQRSFIPQAGSFGPALSHMAAHRSEGQIHLLVQMAEIPQEDRRAALVQEGLVLQGYIPERAWYALVSTGLSAADFTRLGVRWAAPLGLEEKVAPRLRAQEFGPWTEYPEGRRILAVQFHDDVSQSEAETATAWASTVRGGWIASIHTLILAVEPEKIEVLAGLDAVKYVDQLPPVLSGTNDGIRLALAINPLHLDLLTGIGSTVLVYDVGLVDRNHTDFAPSRVTWGENSSIVEHSTHVAGTVAGNGTNSGGLYKGVAPAARIVSFAYEACSPYCLYNSPQDIEANYRTGLLNLGADLASNSLGSNIAGNGYPCSWEGDYELTAQLIDAISNGSLGQPFLSLWAAGNERNSGWCGQYNTIGIPATAKNNIVVGATNSNDHSMAYFSSWGPVDDGRTRPDICAPGCQVGGDNGITSTRPGQGYVMMCGTSMATPATAGSVALILQQWRMMTDLPEVAMPATMKALLINTANDYGNAGPDFQFGYGEIRPTDAISHLRQGYLTCQDTISHGEELIFDVDVPVGQTKLKATLAWDDVAGQLLALRELVNDLDLTCESPSGQFHLPWVLNPATPTAPATRGTDRRNPSEQVLVDTPEAGIWRIHVTGFAIPQGPQKFSLVANAPSIVPAAAPEASIAASGLDLASAPNPFSPRTTIRFRADGSAPVDLFIFDSAGRHVRTLLAGEHRTAGIHFVTWDGKDDGGREVAPGVYFCSIASGGEKAKTKVLLIR